MSRQVVINYEAIAIECRSICEVAEKQLCQIDELLKKIDATSKSLQGYETAGMKNQLRERAAVIRLRIDEIIKQSEKVGEQGTVQTDSDYIRINPREIVEAAQILSNEVNKLTTDDIARYEVLLNTLLESKISENNQNLRLRASGTVAYSAEFSAALDSTKDEVLKGFVYLEWLDNRNTAKTFDEIKSIAESKLKNGAENYFKTERKQLVAQIESEMRVAKLDEKTIASVMATEYADAREQIAEMRARATAELVGESVRKKTLKVVIECIEKKGFIVDRKNIKLQRDKNEVVMIAQKVSGERAEFRVMLDGKFIYKFDGYEGQACQNDIKPFMKDLEDIYGIKIINQEDLWANPDKISTMKYQAVKSKKDGE